MNKKQNTSKDERRLVEIEETLKKLGVSDARHEERASGSRKGSMPARSERELQRRVDSLREALERKDKELVKRLVALHGEGGKSVLTAWANELLLPGGAGSFSDMHPMPYGSLNGGSTPWVGSVTFDVFQPANFNGWFTFSPVYANDLPCICYTTPTYAQAAGAINSLGGIAGTATLLMANLGFNQAAFNPNTPIGAGAAVKAKFHHVKVKVENISAEINRASWGYIGHMAGGVDSLGVTLSSYDTLLNAGQARDLDILKEGDDAWELFMSPFVEDYEFPDEQLPFPQMSCVATLDTDEKWIQSQGFPIFGYFASCPTAQTYRVHVEMGVEYLAAATQFNLSATAQQQPVRRAPPHIPEALNIIPAVNNAKQQVKSANSKHHATFAKHVRSFFGKIGHFLKDPTHDIEVALGLGGAKGLLGGIADAVGDIGAVAI